MKAPVTAAPARPHGPVVLALVLVLLLVRLLTLGAYPLSDATEARYAEIARKMVELNDWVTPWYDYHVPFWAKPPLSTWITALSMKLFGVNEFAARLPHFLAGLLVIALVAEWLRRRDARAALLAAALLTGSVLFFVSAGAVMTDMSMVLGIVMSMRGFWLGLHGPADQQRREQWLFFCGLALGLLAKGPVALVLCGVPIGLWAIWTGNIGASWTGMPWVRGLLLVAVLVLPWYLLAEQRTPGFLNYFIVGEHWKRFTVAGWTGDRYGTAHAVPPGMIWLYALGACLPWALLLPLLAFGRRERAPDSAPHEASLQRYLWVCALAPCLFFTASRNIIWTYFLPGMPALAMLTGAWLARDANQARIERSMAGGLLLSLLCFVATLAWMQLQQGFRTAKLVVAAVENQHADPASLVFVGHGIYTPAFYSRGRATQLRETAQLGPYLEKVEAGKAVPRFVALYGRQWLELSPQLRDRLRPQGRFGTYDLYVIER